MSATLVYDLLVVPFAANDNAARLLKRTDYVTFGGRTVARVENKITPIYVHGDHLGSPVTRSQGGGGLVTPREVYTPFGVTLNNAADLNDQAGFTGHIKDSATDLNYMQARYYDQLIGRFLSIDPVTFLDEGNPSFFNRYSYGFNHPSNMIDPDGQRPRSRGTTPRSISGGLRYQSYANSAYQVGVWTGCHKLTAYVSRQANHKLVR